MNHAALVAGLALCLAQGASIETRQPPALVALPALPELEQLPPPLAADPVFAGGIPMPLLVQDPGAVASPVAGAPAPEPGLPPALAKALLQAESVAAELVTPYSEMTEADFSRILAETPYDPMGADFYEAFGRLGKRLTAEPGRMRAAAEESFQARLGLAKKHNTMFAEMMEPGWRMGAPSAKTYEDRWNGRGRGYAWSYMPAGTARGAQIKEALDASLDPGQAKTLNGWMIWSFEYKEQGRHWSFPVFRSATGEYYMRHANNTDMPAIASRFEELWDKALSIRVGADQRLEAVAEFEWLWVRANPYARAAASTADVLSVLMQKRIEADGIGLRPRPGYRSHDLVALGLSLDRYKRLRLAELQAKKSPAGLPAGRLLSEGSDPSLSN